MSHFTLGLFTLQRPTYEIIDNIMAPYWEGDGCKTKYHVFEDCTEKLLDSYNNETIKKIKTPTGELCYPWDKKIVEIERNYGSLPYGYIEVDIPLNEIYLTFDDYAQEYYGYEKNSNGKYGYYVNPNAKYDWYVVGGRWSGSLIKKNTGDRYDCLPISDIDFDAMEQELLSNLTPYEKIFENSILSKEYLLEMYPTEQDYIKYSTIFSTYSIITPGLKWISQGEMGWFGMSSETVGEHNDWVLNYHKFLQKYKNCYLTIIDCHI